MMTIAVTGPAAAPSGAALPTWIGAAVAANFAELLQGELLSSGPVDISSAPPPPRVSAEPFAAAIMCIGLVVPCVPLGAREAAKERSARKRPTQKQRR